MNSFSYLEPVCCSMSSSNYNFLNCIQVSQEAGQVVWYSHLLKNFQQFMVIHTVKGFGIVNKAEIDVFLELSCFFNYPVGLGNLISGSIAFPKTSLNIWKLLVHILLKPNWGILSITLLHVKWVQLCGRLSILWHWNENWPFPALWPLLSFLNLLACWVKHFNSIIF